MASVAKDLSDLFKTSDELLEYEEGEIQGEIPSWINGSLIRTGPAKFDLGTFTVNHWLDGYALLTKFEIRDSKVRYKKAYLRSEAHDKAVKYGKPIFTEFGTKGAPDPSKNILSRFMNSVIPLEMTDNDCVAIAQIGPDLFATSDTCFLRKVTHELETCERYDTNKIFSMNGVSAHPIREKDGTVYNIGFSCITGLKFNVLKIPGKGFSSKEVLKEAKIIASIPSRWSTGLAYNHSFGLTENYIILIEQPYIVSFSKLAGSVMKGGAAFKDWLEWRGGEETNRFVLIHKTDGRVLKTEYFSQEAFFFLHFINCYEQENEVVVELITYKSPGFLATMYLSDLRSNVIKEADPPTATRFRLPLPTPGQYGKSSTSVTVHAETFTQPGLELPAINRNWMGRKNSYFYVTGTVCQSQFCNTVSKISSETNHVDVWRPSEFVYPGEPVFIPRSGGTDAESEDDGIVISAITDVSEGSRDYLVFIDAKSWTEMGRAYFKAHVPQALHGLFVECNNNSLGS